MPIPVPKLKTLLIGCYVSISYTLNRLKKKKGLLQFPIKCSTVTWQKFWISHKFLSWQINFHSHGKNKVAPAQPAITQGWRWAFLSCTETQMMMMMMISPPPLLLLLFFFLFPPSSFSLFFSFLKGRFSYYVRGPQIYYVDGEGLELLILLPPPEC